MEISIKKSDLILFLKLELFMIPTGFMQNKSFSIIWYGMLFVSICMFLIKSLQNKLKIQVPKVLWFVIAYLGLQTFSTAINHGGWAYNFMTMFIVIFLMLIIQDNLKSNYDKTIRCFKNVLLFNIIFEILLYLFTPFSLLGTLQATFIYYAVWACLSMTTKRKQQWNYEIIIVSFIFVLATIIKPDIGSDGAYNYDWTFYIMVMVFLISDFAINVKSYMISKFNGRVSFISIATLNLIFVIFQVQAKIPGFRFIVEDIMKKDITISGRSHIWEFALNIALDGGIFGYGTGLVGLKFSGGWYDFIKIYGPHNQFLYVFLAGGIVTLTAYIILLIYVCNVMYKNRNYKNYIVYSIGFFVIYLQLLMTYRAIATCMPLFAFFMIITSIYTKKYNQINQ